MARVAAQEQRARPRAHALRAAQLADDFFFDVSAAPRADRGETVKYEYYGLAQRTRFIFTHYSTTRVFLVLWSCGRVFHCPLTCLLVG